MSDFIHGWENESCIEDCLPLTHCMNRIIIVSHHVIASASTFLLYRYMNTKKHGHEHNFMCATALGILRINFNRHLSMLNAYVSWREMFGERKSKNIWQNNGTKHWICVRIDSSIKQCFRIHFIRRLVRRRKKHIPIVSMNNRSFCVSGN